MSLLFRSSICLPTRFLVVKPAEKRAKLARSASLYPLFRVVQGPAKACVWNAQVLGAKPVFRAQFARGTMRERGWIKNPKRADMQPFFSGFRVALGAIEEVHQDGGGLGGRVAQ